MNILGGMDQATSGEVWVNDNNIAEYSAKALTKYRRDAIGFVFQFYNLVQNLTAKENVELAAQICKEPLDDASGTQKMEGTGFCSAIIGDAEPYIK